MKRPSNLDQFARALRRIGRPGNRDQFVRGRGFGPRGRRRGPGSAPAPVEPPRGPLPLQGGAEAPLEFD